MWTNAFLRAAIAATLTLTWSVSPQEIFPAACLIFLLPPHAQTSRLEFAVRASAISLAFVLNSGLLGHGWISGLFSLLLMIALVRYAFTKEQPYRPGWPGLFSLSNKSAG